MAVILIHRRGSDGVEANIDFMYEHGRVISDVERDSMSGRRTPFRTMTC